MLGMDAVQALYAFVLVVLLYTVVHHAVFTTTAATVVVFGSMAAPKLHRLLKQYFLT